MRAFFVSLIGSLVYGVPALAAQEGRAEPWQIDFQPPASPVMEHLVWLHDYLLVIISVITAFVLILLAYTCIRFSAKNNPVPRKFSHNTLVEVLWTGLPVLILVAIAYPSWQAHKLMSDIPEPDVTLKVVGYQWYWNYEYPEEGIQFDSNIKHQEDLQPGEPRLLTVDNPVYIPVNKNVRVLVTGGDVIHAWAMPAFGVKQDTVPGRLNETWFRATKEGTYYGQCSELCGRLHGFMPIQIEVVSQQKYEAWLKQAKQKFAARDFGATAWAAIQETE